MTTDTPMVEQCARAMQNSPAWPVVFDAGSAQVLARAVLECLRTPTPEMEYVGGTKLENMMFGGDEEYTGVIFTDVGVVFRDMVDAALSPSKGEGE